MAADLLADSEELDILDLALRLRWSSVAARAEESLEEIASIDQDGLNVLHWACCNHPSLEIFESILQVRRGDSHSHSSESDHQGPCQNKTTSNAVHIASCEKDSNGMTPLLCACACQAPVPMIAALVNACTESLVITDNDGWTALHYVCCRAKTRDNAVQLAHAKAEIILATSTSPSASLALTRDVFGRTPLSILCSLFEVELRSTYLFRGYACASSGGHLADLWKLACLLIRIVVV
jgi:ankyrin repeat protein